MNKKNPIIIRKGTSPMSRSIQNLSPDVSLIVISRFEIVSDFTPVLSRIV